jgi:hypothetical protein
MRRTLPIIFLAICGFAITWAVLPKKENEQSEKQLSYPEQWVRAGDAIIRGVERASVEDLAKGYGSTNVAALGISGQSIFSTIKIPISHFSTNERPLLVSNNVIRIKGWKNYEIIPADKYPPYRVVAGPMDDYYLMDGKYEVFAIDSKGKTISLQPLDRKALLGGIIMSDFEFKTNKPIRAGDIVILTNVARVITNF